MSKQREFLWLAQILYPGGRAFRMPEPSDTTLYTEGSSVIDSEDDDYVMSEGGSVNGILYRLHRSLAVPQSEAYQGITGVLNNIHPDNPDFTIQDAHDWYRRLGLFDSGLVSFEDMKLAIRRKRSFPLTPIDKQHYLFIEGQLRDAGFDVRIYENRFLSGGSYITKTPEEVLGVFTGASEYDDEEYGDFEYGGDYSNKIVQYLEEDKDAVFDTGSNYKSTFFVAGSTITTFADIDVNRKTEFRQLLIKLKRAETCGLLFVNYV